MRMFLVVFCSFLSTFTAVAQNDIDLTEERKGNEVLVYAQNNRNEAVELTISADIKGFTTNITFPYKVKINANSKVLAFTLIETKGVENSYHFNLSYSIPKQIIGEGAVSDKTRFTDIELNPSIVNIFTKDGCGRCAFAVKYLTDNKIKFNELNTTVHHPNNALMFDKLEAAGFKGGSVTMPVIVYKDKVYYNMQDMAAILKSFDAK